MCLSLLACKEPVEVAVVEPALPFEMGAVLDDPGLAATVSSAVGADTLTSERFNRNLIRLKSMFPDVMADSVQEAQIRREIVKQFVVERLIIREAERLGIAANSDDIQARIDEYRRSFPNDEAFAAELERFEQDESDLVDQFELEITRRGIAELVEDQTPVPSNAEVDEFRRSLAESILAQHILFMVDETMTPAVRSNVAETASAVLDSAQSGVNFGNLARRHSDDAGTADAGGQLPWFRRGDMVAEFEQAAFGLAEPGDVSSRLVLTTYGYHIIRLIDTRTDPLIAADSARTLLWRRHVRGAERALVDSLQSAAVVRVNEVLIPGLAD